MEVENHVFVEEGSLPSDHCPLPVSQNVLVVMSLLLVAVMPVLQVAMPLLLVASDATSGNAVASQRGSFGREGSELLHRWEWTW